jgi:predicted metalloendopeptidase
MTLKAANKFVPQLNFLRILAELAGSEEKIKMINVESPKYLDNLGGVLARTEARTIQAYFIWRAIDAFNAQVDTRANMLETPHVKVSLKVFQVVSI